MYLEFVTWIYSFFGADISFTAPLITVVNYITCFQNLDNMVDRGTKYGDQRLNQRMINHLGQEKYLYEITDEGGLLSIK